MSILGRNDVFRNRGKGLGFSMHYAGAGPGSSTTAGAAASGFHSVQLYFNNIGTTTPGTLVGFPIPPAPANQLLGVMGQMGMLIARCNYLVNLYKLGTLDLTATGNKFTHDGTTFPVTRTQFGEAAKPLSLIPIVYITTATTTTAAVFRLRTVAGGAGYTNQSGSTVVGTKTMTLPSTTTAVNSAYVLRLEDGDSGVQDISNIEVTTSAAAGAATIFGAEILMQLEVPTTAMVTNYDAMFGGLGMNDLVPAAKTGGSALTSYLAIMSVGGTNGGLVPTFNIQAVLNV